MSKAQLFFSEINLTLLASFQAKWDEASKKTIQISTKPCPKCRTPTERDGMSELTFRN